MICGVNAILPPGKASPCVPGRPAHQPAISSSEISTASSPRSDRSPQKNQITKADTKAREPITNMVRTSIFELVMDGSPSALHPNCVRPS